MIIILIYSTWLYTRKYVITVLCRYRCRMFPSLVNCCTIDWFTKWPKDALLSVAENTLTAIVPNDSEKLAILSSICVLIHEVYLLHGTIRPMKIDRLRTMVRAILIFNENYTKIFRPWKR